MSEFREVTEIGWGTRIKDSIKGVVGGGALFLIAFPLLFWNEGRAVDRARDLELGQSQTVSIPADAVDASHEGKLVHLSGDATPSAALQDELGVSATAVKLARTVEMYQWKEKVETKREKKAGGKEVETKDYTYEKVWSEDVIHSDAFKLGDEYVNPENMPLTSKEQLAREVKLGAYKLDANLFRQMSKFEALPAGAETVKALPADLRSRATIQEGVVYVGSPSSPRIGDLRIQFKAVLPATVSVVGRSQSGSIVPHQGEGMSSSISLLEYGQKSAQEMFQAAQSANATLTWVLRLVGFLMMFIGLGMVLKPLSVLADVLPILGTVVSMGASIIAGMVAVPATLITISLAWVFYRPLIGVPMLLLGIGAAVGAFLLAQKRKAAQQLAGGASGAPDQRKAA